MIVNKDNMDKLVEALKDNELVIFPTETVYGIGANALSEIACRKIFKAKNRASDNPLIVHISDKEMLNNVAKDINEIEMRLINSFWPGPFTIILNKCDNIPNAVTAGLSTVAVRMPSNAIAREIIQKCNFPIAAPSANISGRPSGTNVKDIRIELENKVSYILDGGECEVGIESTVVRVMDNQVVILRPGYITKEDIEKVYPQVIYDKHIFEDINNNDKVLSPGMKYKHYAPSTFTVMVDSIENRDSYNVIKKYIKENKEKKIVVLSTSENINKYDGNNVVNVIDIGSKTKLADIAKNMFKELRYADTLNSDIIIIEGVPKEGIGISIMNRLIKACGHNLI